jgi:hypothetical protein
MEDDLKKQLEDDLKKQQQNLFSIPLKFKGKPFLGLAQLSKIFSDNLLFYPSYIFWFREYRKTSWG